MKKLITIAFAFLLLGAGAWWSYLLSPSAQFDKACVSALADTVKSPGSMKIIEVIDEGQKLSDTPARRYLIDSENSYSALVRSRFLCTRLGSIATVSELTKSDWALRSDLIATNRRPVSDKSAIDLCWNAAKDAQSDTANFPPAIDVKVSLENDFSKQVKFSVTSPAWGSARFFCGVTASGKDVSFQMISGL